MAKVSMDCKKIMVSEIASRLSGADTLIVTNYKGLSAQHLNELRKELKKSLVDYLVVKDSIAKKALKDTPNNSIIDMLEGEIGIALHKEDPIQASKILVRFSKDHEVLKIRGGIVKGEIISFKDISVLASLPSREVLLTKLVIILNSPIQGLASSLLGIIRKFVYTISAIKDKKTELDKQSTPTSNEQKDQSGPTTNPIAGA